MLGAASHEIAGPASRMKAKAKGESHPPQKMREDTVETRIMFAFLWVRATFPRFRYDQIMRLGWKVFIPITLVWIVAIGVMMLPPLSTHLPFSIWFGK